MEISFAGTTPYLAPEQLQGKPQPASDQYSLAVVVYEWLCGKRPFNGSPLEIAIQHISKPPPTLREQLPGISSSIEETVMRALAKDPQQRYGSVQDFATALERAYQYTLLPRSSFVTSEGSAALETPETRTDVEGADDLYATDRTRERSCRHLRYAEASRCSHDHTAGDGRHW